MIFFISHWKYHIERGVGQSVDLNSINLHDINMEEKKLRGFLVFTVEETCYESEKYLIKFNKKSQLVLRFASHCSPSTFKVLFERKRKKKRRQITKTTFCADIFQI